uniref:Tetratricopeptide repeat protein 17 n=1 Tax=Ornithorhynchus anatinus TaxID=9258 RepID=A0A6I8NVZ2_ORNAN
MRPSASGVRERGRPVLVSPFSLDLSKMAAGSPLTRRRARTSASGVSGGGRREGGRGKMAAAAASGSCGRCGRRPGPGPGPGRLLSLAVLLNVALRGASATTHWIVTEDGKIQQQKQLVAQKIHIEENEDRDTGLEQRHNKEDPDCIKAKVPLGDLDLYDGTYITLESKNIRPEDYIDTQSPVPPDLEKPDCTKILELPYSIHAFQHLRGVQERVNLSAPLLSKEDPIFTYLSRRLGRSIDDIGHRIHEGLLKNSSSWVLYNMASFYWRIKNEPYQVVECAMRALHFSSRHNKDVALVNLANVLHRAHFSADAAIVIHAALDESDFFTSYYTLGNIYAMLGEYNHSVLCYDHALQAKPGFEQAIKRKHAVLCQQKLEQKLEAQHRSLQRTLNELKEYQKQHDHYLRQQEILEKHKLIQEEQILRNIIHETQVAKEAQLGNHQICRLGNQQRSLHCQWDQPVRYHRGDIFENVDRVQFGEDSSTSTMTSVTLDVQANQSELNHSLQSSPVARSVVWIWGMESDAYRDKQHILWPKRTDCAENYPTIPQAEELPTYFLPPENRGLRVHTSIDKQELSGEPSTPDCSSITDLRNNETLYFLVKELDSHLDLKFKMPDDHARQILFSRINNHTITEEEIGTFLFHSIKKPNDLFWIMLNEAGLYWRALGNSTIAIACLQRALNLAPHQYQDIPLVNLANLLIHYGLHLDASKLLLQALTINSSEPLTFLSLGNAYLALKNISGALKAFRQALDLTTKCPECENSLRLIRCVQFYPFLYNITSSVCSGHCHEKNQDNGHSKQKYFDGSLRAEKEEPTERGTKDHPEVSIQNSGRDSDALRLESTVVAESNGSDGMESVGETQMSEEMLALVDEFENSWPLEAFDGALEVKGRRMDLQGIRVLKKGSQDGLAGSCFGDCGDDDDDEAEWITFQVKRLKKPKAESLDALEPPGRNGEERVQAEIEQPYQTALEISGPKIPSPGPQGKNRDYRSLGWPSPDECLKLRRVELTAVASTWLAVSAKNIDITEHIDFATQLQEPAFEPLCNSNLPASMHTLDHLHGVANRASLHYTGESQLKEVLQNLGKDQYPQQSFEQIGTRIAKVLEKNQTSWVLSSVAALYWRVKGQGKKAIDCLRQALHYAPHHMKDVPLISLANILHNAKLWNDAIVVATMAVEIAPHFVVNHFTLANVYVAMEEFEKAMVWYESTLKLQPEFAPAKNRLRTIQCHLLTKKARRSP